MMKRVRIPLTPHKGRGVPRALRAFQDPSDSPQGEGRSKCANARSKRFQMVPRALRAVPIALTRVPGGFRGIDIKKPHLS